MEKSKVHAFFEEFPFLHDHIRRDRVGVVRVARIDRMFLESMPTAQARYSLPCDWTRTERMLLLGDRGTFLGEVLVDTTNFYGWLDRLFGKKPVRGEAVRDAIARLSEPSQLRLIVHHIVESEELEEVSVIRLPQRFDLFAWLEEDMQRVRQEVRKEILTTDS